MSKLRVIDKKSEKSINSERELLSKLHNPFIVNMHYAFQDSDNLYLVMDLMSGGDLRYHKSRHKKFSEEQTRFFICGIILALEYIHGNNVIHRDIKPENLVLDNKGYIRLTDFGIAKENMPDNSSETSGTPGYMSPEVMNALNHSFPADYFALGVICYEFMKGERPFNGNSRKEIKEQMMKGPIQLNIDNLNEDWSKESADFINKLLVINPENRMGYRDINELKSHLWLRCYPWDMLNKKILPSPFIPENNDNFDRTYCESHDEISKETRLRYEEILIDENYIGIFKNFYYNTDEMKHCIIKENEKNNQKKFIPISKKDNIIDNKFINKNANSKLIKKKKIIEPNNEMHKNKCDDSKSIQNKNNKSKKKKSKLMEIAVNTTRNEKYKKHKKSASVLDNDSKFFNNINNISGNVSNNVIYINFNINNPNISGNYNKNYQDYLPKTDRIIKSYKKNGKNNFYKKKIILANKRFLQKMEFNINRSNSPIHSYKNIKKHTLNPLNTNLPEKIKKNNIPIFVLYKKNKIRNKLSDFHNKETLLDIHNEKQNRFSDFHSFKNNNFLLLKTNNESDTKNILNIKSDTQRFTLNKIRKIEMKNSLKKGTYNFLTNRENIRNININNNSLKNDFFHYFSPYKKNNNKNSLSLIFSRSKDKSIKTSRKNFYMNYSNSNDLSNRQIEAYSMQKKKEKKYNKIKTKNICININKFNKKDLKKGNIKISFSNTRDKKTSFENCSEDIMVDTITLRNRNTTNTIDTNKIKNIINEIDINNKNKMKKLKIAESTRIIFDHKRKNNLANNYSKYISQNNRYKMIDSKSNNNYKANNLSISSIIKNKNINIEMNKISSGINKSLIQNNRSYTNKDNTEIKINNSKAIKKSKAIFGKK